MRALCKAVAQMLSKNMICARPRRNARPIHLTVFLILLMARRNRRHQPHRVSGASLVSGVNYICCTALKLLGSKECSVVSHVAEGPVPAQGPVDPHWYWRVPSNITENRTICACVAKMLADAVTKLPHWLALPKLPKQTKLRKPKKGAKPAPTEARACESHCSLTDCGDICACVVALLRTCIALP